MSTCLREAELDIYNRVCEVEGCIFRYGNFFGLLFPLGGCSLIATAPNKQIPPDSSEVDTSTDLQTAFPQNPRSC